MEASGRTQEFGLCEEQTGAELPIPEFHSFTELENMTQINELGRYPADIFPGLCSSAYSSSLS